MKREISNEIFQAYYAVWFKNGLKRTDLTAAEEAWIDAERERFHALAQREQDEIASEHWFETEERRREEGHEICPDGECESCWLIVNEIPYICQSCYDRNTHTDRWLLPHGIPTRQAYCTDCALSLPEHTQDQLIPALVASDDSE